MVAAVSNESASYIEWEMPVAKGRQYQAIWLEMEGNITAPADGSNDTDAGAWSRISGR